MVTPLTMLAAEQGKFVSGTPSMRTRTKHATSGVKTFHSASFWTNRSASSLDLVVFCSFHCLTFQMGIISFSISSVTNVSQLYLYMIQWLTAGSKCLLPSQGPARARLFPLESFITPTHIQEVIALHTLLRGLFAVIKPGRFPNPTTHFNRCST
jgi:hypothetical protein